MIRYAEIRKQPITLAALEAAIKEDATKHKDLQVRKAVKGWLKKAKDRTAQLVAAGAYIDAAKWKKLPADQKARIPKPIAVDWADVKYLYMEIQHDKCAYCEVKRASRESKGGSGEHHVEHFRPKNQVKSWPVPNDVDFATGEAHPSGYYWLAFHLLNYCTACYTCNTGHKSDYFPIGAARGALHAPPVDLDAAEKPLLIYPLGSADDDPENVIRFLGLAAYPPEQDPFLAPPERANVDRNCRARVTIAFFNLNGRPELLEGRAEKVRELEKSLALMKIGTDKEKADAEEDIRQLMDGSREHTACVRAMVRLYERNVATAREFFRLTREYLISRTPANYLVRAGRIVEGPPHVPRRG